MDNRKIAKELLVIAKELQSGVAKVERRELKKFIKYFMGFYNEEDGIYPIEGLTERDVIKGVEKLFKKDRDYEFEGDSLDREKVRDIILGWRKEL